VKLSLDLTTTVTTPSPTPPLSTPQYCHYVAGLVGIGLSQLFAASGLEREEVGEDHHLANSMGLFLQKTNIIRDYLEDIVQGREFWPREVCVCVGCGCVTEGVPYRYFMHSMWS